MVDSQHDGAATLWRRICHRDVYRVWPSETKRQGAMGHGGEIVLPGIQQLYIQDGLGTGS